MEGRSKPYVYSWWLVVNIWISLYLSALFDVFSLVDGALFLVLFMETTGLAPAFALGHFRISFWFAGCPIIRFFMLLYLYFLRHFELSFSIEDILFLLVLYFKGLELNVLLLGPVVKVNCDAEQEHDNTTCWNRQTSVASTLLFLFLRVDCEAEGEECSFGKHATSIEYTIISLTLCSYWK